MICSDGGVTHVCASCWEGHFAQPAHVNDFRLVPYVRHSGGGRVQARGFRYKGKRVRTPQGHITAGVRSQQGKTREQQAVRVEQARVQERVKNTATV